TRIRGASLEDRLQEPGRARGPGHAALPAILAAPCADAHGQCRPATPGRSGPAGRRVVRAESSERLEHAEPAQLPEARLRRGEDRRATRVRSRRLSQRGRSDLVATVYDVLRPGAVHGRDTLV